MNMDDTSVKSSTIVVFIHQLIPCISFLMTFPIVCVFPSWHADRTGIAAYMQCVRNFSTIISCFTYQTKDGIKEARIEATKARRKTGCGKKMAAGEAGKRIISWASHITRYLFPRSGRKEG
jgi:hypothetical protein